MHDWKSGDKVHDTNMHVRNPEWTGQCMNLLRGKYAGPGVMQRPGGFETMEKILERHRKYCLMPKDSSVFAMQAGSEILPTGETGYWKHVWTGITPHGTGWRIPPKFHGHDVATAAVRRILEEVHREFHGKYPNAFPSIENTPPDSISWENGFSHTGEWEVECPPANKPECNELWIPPVVGGEHSV
ncbi:MAG: hypothetical protein M1162_04385 [Candidatus Thermoplasmatota archaeon]|nr:hypothetical protein [Candidatus Thermoplasmatota archaeon]